MIIESSYETINSFIEFLYYNSVCVELYSNGFDYSNIFGNILLDLLANCNKIENVDYSKFIAYIMLSKFYPNKDIPIIPVISLPTTLKPKYLENLTTSLMHYRKCIKCITRNYYKPKYKLISNIYVSIETVNFEIHSYDYVIVENSLIASTCLNIIVEQEYKYRPQITLANSFAYYLCLLF